MWQSLLHCHVQPRAALKLARQWEGMSSSDCEECERVLSSAEYEIVRANWRASKYERV